MKKCTKCGAFLHRPEGCSDKQWARRKNCVPECKVVKPEIQRKRIEELYHDAMLGELASRFINEDLGRYLLECAIRQEDSANVELQQVDPTDAAAIRKFQLQARTPKLLFAWLEDAIRIGNNAIQILTEEETNGL